MHINATGLSVYCAMPMAANAALRSSTIIQDLMRGSRAKLIINGALREPGDSTAYFTLLAINIRSDIDIACILK